MKKLVWTACLALLCGCTQGENPTNVIEVSGKAVAADGRPLQHVELTFFPTKRGGTTATAKVGADGTFVPTTLNNQKGIVPGSYKVVIARLPGKSGTPVPPKYAEEFTTDVRVDVEEGAREITVKM